MASSRRPRITTTAFNKGLLPSNPIEIAAQPFIRLRGRQLIELWDLTTGFKASAVFGGGKIENTGGYTIDPSSNFYVVYNTAVNATITRLSTNVYQLSTSAGDSGGRTYVITFSPFAEVRPTIQKVSGAPIFGNFFVTLTDSVRVHLQRDSI